MFRNSVNMCADILGKLFYLSFSTGMGRGMPPPPPPGMMPMRPPPMPPMLRPPPGYPPNRPPPPMPQSSQQIHYPSQDPTRMGAIQAAQGTRDEIDES